MRKVTSVLRLPGSEYDAVLKTIEAKQYDRITEGDLVTLRRCNPWLCELIEVRLVREQRQAEYRQQHGPLTTDEAERAYRISIMNDSMDLAGRRRR